MRTKNQEVFRKLHFLKGWAGKLAGDLLVNDGIINDDYIKSMFKLSDELRKLLNAEYKKQHSNQV